MKRSWTAIKGIELEETPLASLSEECLCDMHAAALEVQECYRVLKRGDINIVGELLKGQGTFFEFNHYPKGDVFDNETGSQYYYHSHRGLPGEHGHFHTFARGRSIPQDMQPVPYDGKVDWPKGGNLVTHFVAVSMDRFGFPIGFFATNRWVTDEAWFRAEDMIQLLDAFELDHAYPSWPTNRWLTAMLRLFRPEVEALLRHRDAVVERWAEDHPNKDVYEDRKLEVTGHTRLYVNEQTDALKRLVAE